MSDNKENKKCTCANVINSIRNFYINENDTKNKKRCKMIVTIIISSIIVISALLLQNCNQYFGYIIALLFQFCVCTFLLVCVIPMCANKKYPGNILSFVTIMLFIFSTTLFIVNYNKIIVFRIINPIILLSMLYFVNKYVEMGKDDDDLSHLKAMNYVLASLFSVVIFFPSGDINNEHFQKIVAYMKCKNIDKVIGYYCLVPLLMLQALYELLEGKIKRNAKVPDTMG